MAALAFGFTSDRSDADALPLSSAIRPSSEADWMPHQATIRKLYLDENRSLKDVMAIMTREHGFKATSDYPSIAGAEPDASIVLRCTSPISQSGNWIRRTRNMRSWLLFAKKPNVMPWGKEPLATSVEGL